MSSPLLEQIAQSLNYADLPETWRVPEIEHFSIEKTLYDYQTDALKNAARALYRYYDKDGDERKETFSDLYRGTDIPPVKKYETRGDRNNDRQNPVFKILADYIRPFGDEIPYHNFINRMCFWMATGSGKTLVMVKLIAYLHSLIKHGEIPPHNILMLAPSEQLLKQIRQTVDEFNQSGLHIDLVPLREIHRNRQARIGDTVTVYYHRSDNISDVQKDALTDYRVYENDGKWYVFLDEAHKGGKEDSKRQAYYKVMTRDGFLFNFSATFTESEDIVTTVKKYNLENFVQRGHGKSIYLNEEEYTAFSGRREEISHDERRKIVLKSLITLGYVSLRVARLRKDTGIENLYHNPLMLTLVNSVNTDVENDLLAFFQTLREIATGDIDETFFKESKEALIADWRNARLLFGEDGGGIIGTDEHAIKKIKITDLREAVFLSRRKGSLQFIRSTDDKELAFQMKNADAPFALIRIGNTSKWRRELLSGFEETTALQEKSFFDELEQSSITILMGSRSFFESWDSNRPNVINFINIGGKDAKKFVVQSIGRGVRIETLPGKRRRLSHLVLQGKEKVAMEKCHDLVQPPETLFVFATNRKAVKSVLQGLETEKGEILEKLEGLEKAPVPKIGGREMPLLIPKYKEIADSAVARAKFAMSKETLGRLKNYVERTSDAVFTVRDGLETAGISTLRATVKTPETVQLTTEKNYAAISFLQNRLISHFAKTAKASDGVRELDGRDIVHFRHIRVRSEYINDLQAKINRVKQGEISDQEKRELAGQYAREEITETEFDKKKSGKNEETFKELTIRKLLGHYYLPVITGNDKAHYIQHIIKVKSEINFLNALEVWTKENTVPWDAWMFSKIDESLDRIHIPYYDTKTNDYRRFLPDFVFWMCKGNQYRIVFVDPKGTEFASAYRKIDGYKKLFEEGGGARVFDCKNNGLQVQVKLYMFNAPDAPDAAAYRDYWTDEPERIFQAA